MNTHASWKNGLLEDPTVERRRECVGDVPMRLAKEASYWRRLTWSVSLEELLKRPYESWGSV
jgi:hypothetical protein